MIERESQDDYVTTATARHEQKHEAGQRSGPNHNVARRREPSHKVVCQQSNVLDINQRGLKTNRWVSILMPMFQVGYLKDNEQAN